MSKNGYTLAFSKIASAVLAVVLVCSLSPFASAFGDDDSIQNNPVTPVVDSQDGDTTSNPQDGDDGQDESTLPSESDSEEETSQDYGGAPVSAFDEISTDSDETLVSAPVAAPPAYAPETEISTQSSSYTIESFVGSVDANTPLAIEEITESQKDIGGDKETVAQLGLPTSLWVMLDAASLAAYQTDNPTEYAASEAARLAYNTAVSDGTLPPSSGIDPYTTTLIPAGAIQVGVTLWTCNGDNGNAASGNYQAVEFTLNDFTPVLDADFGLATGLEMPYVEVQVDAAQFLEPDWIALVNTYTAGKGNDAYSERFYSAVSSFAANGLGNLTWTDSGVAAADRWDGTVDASCPVVGTTYSPLTPEQFLYALGKVAADTGTTTTPYTINLPADGKMDLGGREHNLWPYIKVVQPLTINGNGCTLYNLYMCNDKTATISAGDHGVGLVSDVISFVVSDLDIDGTNLLGFVPSGQNNNNGVGSLVGKLFSDSPKATIDSITNVQVRNSLTVARGNGSGALLGRFADANPSPSNSTRILEDCSSINAISMGGDHIGGLTGAIAFNGGLNRNAYVNRCYSVEAIIVSYGTTSKGHSGGLFSCIGGSDYGIANCFVDAQVYGQSECGVFTGSANSTTRVALMNCFSSGFVDGESKLGGFVGSAPGGQTYFFDCYSTALVGVNSAGEKVGGFLGYAGLNHSSGGVVGMSNCYAAGEVGNAATESEGATKGVAQATGAAGFIGSARSNATNSLAVVVNSFYDKQTTAMREYDVGNTSCLCLNKVLDTGNGGNDTTYITNIMKSAIGNQGLQGCLTSTTDKEGAGLTGAPGAAVSMEITTGVNVDVGFTGMRDDKACMGPYFSATYKGWGDVSAKAQAGFGWDTSAEGHYPELEAFSANAAGFSPEDAAVAAAYSKSSTSTALLDTWEKGLDAATGDASGADLLATTYDTVRDITIRFNLTGTSVDNWTTTTTQDGAPNTQAITNIKGDPRKVLELFHEGTWYASQFAPGMEWLQVTTSSGDVTATRRFRVTPSAGLDAGESRNVYATTDGTEAIYDHADDVVFYFTTAARWDEHDYDVTTGVYPDTTEGSFPAGGTPNGIKDAQRKYANDATDALFNSFFGASGTNTNDHYGVILEPGDILAYPGVDMSYMARNYDDPINENNATSDNVATGSKVFTYVRPIKYFDASNNNQVIVGDIVDMTVAANANSFNGYKAFQGENMQYLVEYVWELSDGRLIRDAKIITVKSLPFEVSIDAYESGAIDATVAAQKDVLHDTDDALVGSKSAITSVTSEVFDEIEFKPEHASADADVKSHTVVAWAVTNPLKQVNQIKVDFIFDPAVEGGEPQHYYATLDNPKAGDTITIPYKFWRIVTLENGVYYSIPQLIHRDYTVGEMVKNGVTYQYLFFDKDMEDEETGIKVLDMEDDAQVDVELSEALILHKSIEGTYADKTRTFDFDIYYTDDVARADEENHVGNTYTYLLWDDKGTPDDYSDDVQVMSGTNPVTGTITAYDTSPATKSGTVSLTDNQYISIVGGTVGDTYQFKETGATDYITTVLAEDGTLVGSTANPDKHDQWDHYGNLLAQATAFDTGVLTLPVLAEVDPEDPNTYNVVPADYSRTMFTNTYKEIVPSGIKTDVMWPWWLLAAAILMVSLASGNAVYRNNRLGKVAVQGRHSKAVVQGKHSKAVVQGKHSKVAVQGKHGKAVVQGKHGKAVVQGKHGIK